MATIEPVSFQVARLLLNCFCDALAANAAEDPTIAAPRNCCLRPGVDVPLDVDANGNDLCCEGEAWVKIVSVYPSSQFPVPDEAPLSNPCQLQRLTVALELGIMRCIPEDATCEERTDKLRIMMADADAAFRAACCWGDQLSKTVGRGTKWFAGSFDQGGPDGLCLTGTMSLFASIKGPGCC